MTETNGTKFKIIMYLVGVLVTLICFVAIPTLANNMIINDKDSRTRDALLQNNLTLRIQESDKRFHTYCMRQEEFNGELKSTLASIAKDIEYIKGTR